MDSERWAGFAEQVQLAFVAGAGVRFGRSAGPVIAVDTVPMLSLERVGEVAQVFGHDGAGFVAGRLRPEVKADHGCRSFSALWMCSALTVTETSFPTLRKRADAMAQNIIDAVAASAARR